MIKLPLLNIGKSTGLIEITVTLSDPYSNVFWRAYGAHGLHRLD
jgi:hypothetical protein